MKTVDIAIVGATGNVGCRIISILEERNFPVKNLHLLASEKSVGKILKFNQKNYYVENLADFDFSKCDVAIFAAGSNISSQYIPIASNYCVCLDNSSFYRMDHDIPLIIPEVNPHRINDYKKKNIIANPNCSTSQAVLPLRIINDLFKLKSIIFSTYQSVSGAGLNAMNELIRQCAENCNSNQKLIDGKLLDQYNQKMFAFNVIPQIDVFMENDLTKEEWKMEEESKKILEIDIPIHANCARVPVLIGHSEYINVETEFQVDVEKLKIELSKSEGIKVFDNPKNNEYLMPYMSAGRDEVFISRIRKNNAVKNGISFWCVSDNLRKGAALNNVQILELLIKHLP